MDIFNINRYLIVRVCERYFVPQTAVENWNGSHARADWIFLCCELSNRQDPVDVKKSETQVKTSTAA